MGRSLTDNDGYKDAGQTVEIAQQLTERQFREIERILDRPPARFKAWSDRFAFNPPTNEHSSRLRSYLIAQGICHWVEQRTIWTPAGERLSPSWPPPPLPPNRLVELANARHLTALDLEDLVQELASEYAGEINEEGLPSQVAYIEKRLGSEATERRIEDLGDGRAGSGGL
jgi:hypothetical protein